MSQTLRLTTEDYGQMVERGAFDHLDRKIELIRGEIRQMNPAGPIHDGLIIYLTSWSARMSDPNTVLVSSQTGLNLSPLASQPEPDVLWVRKARYLDRHPGADDVLLAIEVAFSSLKNDLLEKAELYAEAGIVEYWVVDSEAKCIHVLRNPHQNAYADRSIVKPGETICPLVDPQALLDVGDLFIG